MRLSFSWSIPFKGMVVLFSFLQVVATSTKVAGYSRLETNIGELVITSTNLSDRALPVTSTGLANGTPYRFAIPAVNVVGVSPASESLLPSPSASNGPLCNTYTNKKTANGLGSDVVNDVFAIGSTVYAATQGGLSISTDGGTSFTNYFGIYGVNDVYAIGSTVYAATTVGLSISTDGGTSFTNKTTANGLGRNVVNAVYAIGSTVYAATQGGLSISTDGGTSFTNKTRINNGLGSDKVNAVYAIGSTVYAATQGGLSISTDGGTSFTNYTTTNGLGSNGVNAVYAIGNTVYAATGQTDISEFNFIETTKGLSISTDGGTSFTNYTFGSGSNTVYDIYAIGSTVYAATKGGLSISTDGGTSFTNYTTTNGLGDNRVYGVFADGNTVYAATAGGLSFCTIPPTITSFTPTSAGSTATVTLTGTAFTGATAVSFGGTAATSFTVVSATSITAMVAAGTSGNVSVTTPSGTGVLAGFTFIPPPVITSFSPASGPAGTLVTITGTNLGSPTAFTIGGTAAIVISNTGTSLVGMVMPGAATGTISLTTAGGSATSTGTFTLSAAPAPNAQQGAKLVGTENSGAAWQGYAVSLSADGTTAIVGGYMDDSQKGAVWIFTRSGATWSQQAKLVGNNSIGGAGQGLAVSLSADGNTAIVGGYTDNSFQGAAWIFTRSGTAWSQQAKLVGIGGSGVPSQGSAVSISADGNTAIVGGAADDLFQGAAWIYTRSGTTWTQQGAKLVGTGAVGAAEQGTAVSMSADGTTAIVGGFSDNSQQGAAWIYTRSGATWTQQGAKLVGTGNTGAAQQGIAVSLSADGNTAIVGGNADNSYQGAAWVFTRSGTTWTQQGNKLVGTGAVGNTQQGLAVSLSADGNTAIVGGNRDNSDQGAAWIYTRSGATWSQQGAKLVGTGNTGAARQGTAVSLSADGTTAIVGGYNDNSQQGAAWVYTYVPPPTITGLTGDAVSFVHEGSPVALDASANAQVADSDSPDFNGGTVTVSFASNTGIAAEDKLGITNQGSATGQIGVSGSNVLFEGVVLGTFTGGTSGANLVVTLNATATPTSVAALLRALNYSNLNATSTIGQSNRQVAITMTDGDGGTSETATVTVSISMRTLSIVSGNNQSGPVNQALAAGPILKVLNAGGSPTANVSLTVTANAGQIRLPVLSNLSDTYTTGGSLIDNINWKAHQFTTGNTAVILDQVALLLNIVASASYPSTVQVEAAIYTVNNFGVPGIEIGTSGIQSAELPAATTWKTLVFTNPIELSPNTSYALVVKGSNSTGFIWGNVRPGSTGPTGWAAFVSSKTTDRSITNWVDGAVRNAFILTGSTPLSATQTLVTNSDGTAALGSWILGDRAGTQELVVSNGNLQGSPLTITASATAALPSAPTNLSYTPGNGQVSLSFTPGYDGGSAITNYLYSLDNGSSWTAFNPADTSSPVTITGLTNGGTYPVRIRAVNVAGQGAASAAISVNSVIPLTNPSITVDPIANQTYTGSALTPAIVVKDGNTTLAPTTDYTITSYADNINVGTATVTITGAGNYSGTKTQAFSIVAKAASTLTIDAIANPTYTGSALTPAVVVKDGSTTLTATTDYTTTYTSNTNVGTVTVTITGVGNYSGTKTQTFSIVAKAASSLTIEAIATQTYTGSALTPAVVVKDGSTTLTATTDYTVTYTANTNVGTATVTITGAGNYTGTKDQTFVIVAKAASTLAIDAIANQTYTVSALTPAVVVKDGNTTLTATTDYTVAYTTNTNVGTATVTITGAGNYSGTKTQTFSIVAKAASTLSIDAIANQTYTGSALTPAVVVKDGATTLASPTNYTAAYSNNTNAGTATVTITGAGNYSGTKTQTFAIQPKALTIRAVNATKVYGDANPSLSFMYSGLVEGDTEIDQLPSISTSATTTSGVGNYPITLTGGSDPNYSLTREEGVLEITPAKLVVIVNAATKIYGQEDPEFTFSLQGLKASYSESILRGGLIREAGEEPGTYRIASGTISAGVNYTLSVTEANLQILKARALSVAELALVTTDWSKEAALPATVNLLATHGQYFQVEVKWDKSKLNLLARGTYSLTGTLLLPAGIENPDQVLAKIKVQVLPKPAPREVTIDNSTFVGSTSVFFIPVGAFVITDPVDKTHVVSFLGDGYDNKFFFIKDNVLYWNSAERAPGKTTFSIVVRVTDRDGNTLDKLFEIKRTRLDFSSLTINNSYTPNGDRFNDAWGVPELRFYEGVRVSVYERGGGRVFYTENPDIRWDGTYNGKEMPAGSYFWTIEVIETGELRRGMLNLIRK